MKRDQQDSQMDRLGEALKTAKGIEGFPMIVAADDANFTAQNLDNFLRVTFTRSDPATGMYGVGGFTHAKHRGAKTAVIIDARLKTYHAPELEVAPEVEKRVDALGAVGGSLHGIIWLSSNY